jgi:hypothetical protein
MGSPWEEIRCHSAAAVVMLALMICDPPEPKLLATVRDYDELIAAIRARRDELEVTHETIGEVAGIASGHASKLLCDPPMKRMGIISLGAVLGALGLKLIVVEDEEALARVRRRLVKRQYPRQAQRRRE